MAMDGSNVVYGEKRTQKTGLHEVMLRGTLMVNTDLCLLYTSFLHLQSPKQ